MVRLYRYINPFLIIAWHFLFSITAYARYTQLENLHDLIPESDAILIGQFISVRETGKASEYTKDMYAQVRVVEPIKNTQKAEIIGLYYEVKGNKAFMANPPNLLNPKLNSEYYLMFLKSINSATNLETKKEFVAFTAPSDPVYSVIELNRKTELLKSLKEGADLAKKSLIQEAEALLAGEMRGPLIEEYYNIEFYETIMSLITENNLLSPIGIENFREYCNFLIEDMTNRYKKLIPIALEQSVPTGVLDQRDSRPPCKLLPPEK